MNQAMTTVTERTDDDDVEVVSLKVGNALVIHQAAAMTSQAREIALTVAADTEHDLVVVDLPPGSSSVTWGRVADVLPRRRRGIRLIIGDRPRETKALAAQLLAERISRTVVAPDGVVRPGIDGALFVDSGPGTGWVRCQPGRTPQWISKRFPRPAWDVPEIGRSMATSATGVAEPVLGGVWIRPAGDDTAQSRHRDRLQEHLPCQHEVFAVVLGCPGAQPITLDDVARFWEHLPVEVRGRARFVEYGPVTRAGAGPVGQALADLLGKQVVCYTGLPVGSSRFPEVLTIRADGSWGWNSPARELAYTPRRGDEPAAAPALLSYRAPLDDVAETGPAAYWYAPDAVVEVIPAGLWVRGSTTATNAAPIRGRPIDADHLLVVFDTSSEAVERRMRVLAADLVAWLDETTRASAVIVPAHEVTVTPSPVRGPALAEEGGEMPGTETQSVPELAALAGPARPTAALAVAGPELAGPELPATALADAFGPVSAAAFGAVAAGIQDTPETERSAPSEPASRYEAAPMPPADVLAHTATALAFAKPPEPTTAFESPTHTTSGPTTSVPAASAPVASPAVVSPAMSPAGSPFVDVSGSPAADQMPPASPATEPLIRPPAAPAGFTTAVSAPGPPRQSTEDRARPEPVRSAPAGADAGALPPVPKENKPAATAPNAPRFQPTPDAAVAALIAPRGLEEERTWLRKARSRQYAALANSVGRILSEHPGFHDALAATSGAVLTDAVSVRLYLSSEGDDVDTALRSGRGGPHVPFARCVVSGLSRLPSHRGATVFRMTPTDAQWEKYHKRSLVTDWGFVNTLACPYDGQDGDVDVSIWSITGRRTKLLEPDDAPVVDRVLFTPGTNFKVLSMGEPSDGRRGHIMLRELAAAEIAPDGRVTDRGLSFDEIALEVLRGAQDSWAATKPRRTLPASAGQRFRVLPGLL
jgi:hypothetical protein